MQPCRVLGVGLKVSLITQWWERSTVAGRHYAWLYRESVRSRDHRNKRIASGLVFWCALCDLTSQILCRRVSDMLKMSHSRALHVVDIENLTGLPRPALADVVACHEAYRPLIRDHDLVVVACNHGAFLAAAWGWPDARWLVRSGENGADHALLDVLIYERVEQRFETVVVASGDGVFADTVARLGGLGVTVTVVARPGSLSRRLRMAARHVLTLSPVTALYHSEEPA
jgi:hypothetical protein